MFLGTYRHQIDEKNRFRTPKSFKTELGESFALTKGSNGCIYAFSKDMLENTIAPKINQISLFDEKAQKPLRMLLASAFFTEEDKQGRILLPQELKSFASIVKNIVTIGVGNRVEIWAEEKWNEYNKDMNFDDAVNGLTSYGI
ncbi:MAG: division/cell wall cluster transcriptional repressor MraZ [Clostridia bacterium]